MDCNIERGFTSLLSKLSRGNYGDVDFGCRNEGRC